MSTRPESFALRGRVVSAGVDLPDAVVEVRGDVLGYVGPAADWSGPTTAADVIVPGLVDLHCHGGGGHDVATSAGEAAAHHRAHGTTSMLASLVSGTPEELLAGVTAIGASISDAPDAGLVGVHLEGPWLDHDHRGAHDPARLSDPDVGLARRLLAAGPVRMVTLAPERPGATEVTRALEDAGVLVGLGHTGATAEEFAAALAGSRAGHVTHLFNGMEPLHHRRPGPVAAALTALADGATTVELIADGVHLADETVAMVFAVNPDGVVLVSDAMVAAGMPDGRYRLGALEVDVESGSAWTVATPDAPRSLAGGTAHLSDVLRRCIVDAGVDPVAAVTAATATPASRIGLTDRGSLTSGLRADLLVLDTDWRVQRVLAGGGWVR